MTRIGVSGHRHFLHAEVVTAMTAEVIERLVGDEPDATVLSNLAEGADRLVAELVLARPGARLEAVLPLPVEVYIGDFVSADSRRRFTELVDEASSVTVVQQVPGEARDTAYERAGRAIVDASDVLVALWDGEPARGRGGTADIVQYALDHDVLVEMILVERGP